MQPGEKAALYRELAKMTAADFHLDRSLALLLRQKSRPRRRALLERLQRGLAAGQSVAEAITSDNTRAVSPLEISMIEAGERSGKLSAAFAHLAHYFTTLEAARREALRAMIYPLILLHLAVILPEIPAAIASPEAGNPLRKIAMTIACLWVLMFIGVQLWRWLSARAQTSSAIDRLLNRLPLIGSVRRHWALARFTQVFHAGLLAALRMSKIVRMAGDASQSGGLRAAAGTAATAIESGESVAQALTTAGVFPIEFINSVATAEEVGSLDEEMTRWSASETTLASEAIQRAAVWLPKIGYGIISLYVVYRILGMVEGYYGGILRQFDR